MHRYWRPNWITVVAYLLIGCWAIRESRVFDSNEFALFGYMFFAVRYRVVALLTREEKRPEFGSEIIPSNTLRQQCLLFIQVRIRVS